jgi:hypothetical protein
MLPDRCEGCLPIAAAVLASIAQADPTDSAHQQPIQFLALGALQRFRSPFTYARLYSARFCTDSWIGETQGHLCELVSGNAGHLLGQGKQRNRHLWA